MVVRLVTGLLLAPLVVWLLLAGPIVAIVAALVFVAAAAASEILGMWPFARRRDVWLGALLAALLCASPYLGAQQPFMVLILSTVVVLAFSLLRPGDDVEVAAQRAAVNVFSLAYVGGLGAAMTALVITPAPLVAPGVTGTFSFGPSALLTLLAIVFLGDTGAYFSGKFLGRHKLYPAISPKKTVEGTIGGLFASVVGGIGFGAWLLPQIPIWELAILALLCGAVAQVGDLTESLFKRASHTKDSGKLLPGHGGMLDRIDGVLFAAPVFWGWLQVAY